MKDKFIWDQGLFDWLFCADAAIARGHRRSVLCLLVNAIAVLHHNLACFRSPRYWFDY